MSVSTLFDGITYDETSASLELTPDWLQGRTAYGGWQAALGLRAMEHVLGEPVPLRSLQVNFIAPVPPGKVTARAELLRRGKSAAQLEARILIDGKVAFAALGIFGAARESAVREVPVAPASAVAVETVADAPQGGLRPAFTGHFDMRWGAGLPPFSGAEHSDAEIFVRYCNEPVSSDAHLVCLADAIPPSAISMFKAPGMLSSMNWTLEFVTPMNAAERAGWLRFDSGLTAAGDGYGWENTMIWSEQGRLVAISRQCVALFG